MHSTRFGVPRGKNIDATKVAPSWGISPNSWQVTRGDKIRSNEFIPYRFDKYTLSMKMTFPKAKSLQTKLPTPTAVVLWGFPTQFMFDCELIY